jgi:hypothetical protein
MSTWDSKIEAAEVVYADWEKRFKVRALEDYFEGFQWSKALEESEEPYVINLFFSSIEAKSPSLSFNEPVFRISPTARSLEENSEIAFEYATNNENVLNTWVLDSSNNFSEETKAAIDDAWARFGIIEVGYESDYISNPKSEKPAFKDDYEPRNSKNSKPRIKRKPTKPSEREKVFIKNIPAERFRVSAFNDFYLDNCDWCGYFEYVRVDDLKSVTDFKNLDKIAGYTHSLNRHFDEEERKMLEASPDVVRLWKIWDTRLKKKFYIVNGHEIYSKDYEFFPFIDLRLRTF